MSRRQVTNRRELLLPLQIPDRHQTGVVFDACIPSGPAMAINDDNAGEPLNARPRHSTDCRATEQPGQTTEGAIADLIAGDRLLAQLVFQRIRPCSHAGMMGGQNCSPELQASRAPIAPPDIATSLIKCTEVPVSAPVPAAIETLFTQLARRRLRTHAPEERR